jgi:hypothetical protein
LQVTGPAQQYDRHHREQRDGDAATAFGCVVFVIPGFGGAFGRLTFCGSGPAVFLALVFGDVVAVGHHVGNIVQRFVVVGRHGRQGLLGFVREKTDQLWHQPRRR